MANKMFSDGTVTQTGLTKSEKDDYELAQRLSKTYAGFTGFARGKKISNGKLTDKDALIIYVEEKKPLDQLLAEGVKPIPSMIGGVLTDVVQSGKLKALNLLDEPKKSLWEQVKEFFASGVDRKSRMRPFDAGMSVGNVAITAGTCGKRFWRPATSKYVMFTNAHVGTVDLRKTVTDQPEKRCVQPGMYDHGNSNTDVIGSLCMMIMADKDGTVPVFNDACLIDLTDQASMTGNVLEAGGIRGITTVAVGDTVWKSGRTTGLTNGTVQNLDMTAVVNYGTYTLTHLHCMQFSNMSAGGDSGSVMYVKKTDGNYLTAYLFAGSADMTIGHTIQNMMSAFSVTLDSGTEPPVEPPVDEDAFVLSVSMSRAGEFKNVALTVKDNVSGKGIKGVSCRLIGDDGIQTSAIVFTDTEGKVVFDDVKVGGYSLKASFKPRYMDLTQSILVK